MGEVELFRHLHRHIECSVRVDTEIEFNDTSYTENELQTDNERVRIALRGVQDGDDHVVLSRTKVNGRDLRLVWGRRVSIRRCNGVVGVVGRRWSRLLGRALRGRGRRCGSVSQLRRRQMS